VSMSFIQAERLIVMKETKFLQVHKKTCDDAEAVVAQRQTIRQGTRGLIGRPVSYYMTRLVEWSISSDEI